MKKFKSPRLIIQILMLFLAVSTTSCVVHSGTATKTKKVPPGQAKKISGEKSAKNYAPGHNK